MKNTEEALRNALVKLQTTGKPPTPGVGAQALPAVPARPGTRPKHASIQMTCAVASGRHLDEEEVLLLVVAVDGQTLRPAQRHHDLQRAAEGHDADVALRVWLDICPTIPHHTSTTKS